MENKERKGQNTIEQDNQTILDKLNLIERITADMKRS